ncbi:hypothetical protein AALP_AA1G279000 [Arabis alpina]|uniref:F-box domain-containing protein n=1 Tax=Arabis alpina TaxID=50452 RepID=A0A087HR42_ARAAL|nr:hypothetical protein AALP_AA1G279000 [Arabis alpina]
MENMICALPDDLLLRILLLIPTKEAFATTILSKRWRYVSTMLPELEFKYQGSQSVGWFTDRSVQLHNALILDSLIVELGPHCPIDVDVGKWVQNAVNRRVLVLDFKLLWTAQPTSFPKCLYTCDTLVVLILSNEILVDVSSEARLPSLLKLSLLYVLYKDEDSLVRLLSSSPVLKYLKVERREADNLSNFTVKVSSLQRLTYETTESKDEVDDDGSLLVIDCPALTDLALLDVADDYCFLMENMSCLDMAYIDNVVYPDDNLISSLSSVIHLHLCFTQSMAVGCNVTNFSRLIELYFLPDVSVDWLEPFMLLLHNSPNLKTLTIDTHPGDSPPSWNQPSYVPGCLSSHLEIFRRGYCGGSEDEIQLVKYILANSKCLKTVEISLIGTCNLEEKRKEMESLPRISTSSQLLFPTQLEWRFNGMTAFLP